MADDNDIGIKGFEVARRVLEGLALLEGAGFGGEINDVGGEALGGEFEGDAGASGRFDKEVDDGFAAQGRDFFDGAFTDSFKGFGGVEDEENFFGAQGLDVEEMFAVPGHVRFGDGIVPSVERRYMDFERAGRGSLITRGRGGVRLKVGEIFEDFRRIKCTNLAISLNTVGMEDKKPVNVRLNGHVLMWLKSKGKGHLTRINEILLRVMEAEQRAASRKAAQ